MDNDRQRQLPSRDEVNSGSSYDLSFLDSFDASHSTNLTEWDNSERRSVKLCALALDGQEPSCSDQQSNINRHPTPSTIYSLSPDFVQPSYSISSETNSNNHIMSIMDRMKYQITRVDDILSGRSACKKDELSKHKTQLRKKISEAYKQTLTLEVRQRLVSYLFDSLNQVMLDVALPEKAKSDKLNYKLISDVILYCQRMSDVKERNNYINKITENFLEYACRNKGKIGKFVSSLEGEVITILIGFIKANPHVSNYATILRKVEKFSEERNNPQSSSLACRQEQQPHEGYPSCSNSSSFLPNSAQPKYPISSETNSNNDIMSITGTMKYQITRLDNLLRGGSSSEKNDKSHLFIQLRKKIREAYKQPLTLEGRQYLVSYLFDSLEEDMFDLALPVQGQSNKLNYKLISDVILHCQRMSGVEKRNNYIKKLIQNFREYANESGDKIGKFVFSLEEGIIEILVGFINTSCIVRNNTLILEIEKFSKQKSNPQSSSRACSQEQQSHEQHLSCSNSSSFLPNSAQPKYPTSRAISAQSQDFGGFHYFTPVTLPAVQEKRLNDMIRMNTSSSDDREHLILSCNHLVLRRLCSYEDILNRVDKCKTKKRFVEELKKVIQEKMGCDVMPNSSMESVDLAGPSSRSFDRLH